MTWRAETEEEKPRKSLCADAHGFSLHAAVRLPSHQRKALERLCRTITRPALANERLSRYHGVLAPNAKLRAALIPHGRRRAQRRGSSRSTTQPDPIARRRFRGRNNGRSRPVIV
jgi:hypothetical protein